MERQLSLKTPMQKLDPDSPTTREACRRLGINAQDVVKKSKHDIVKNCENQKIAEIRYQNYMSRYTAAIKSVFDERKSLLNKPQSASQILAGSLISPQAQNATFSLIGMRQNKSIIGFNNDHNGMAKTLMNNFSNQSIDRRPQSILPSIGRKETRIVFSQSPANESRIEMNYTPQVYFKIANEYQKMNENKVKTQIDLKNFLLKQKENEKKLAKLDEKLKKIESLEKEEFKELREKSQHKEQKRQVKLQRVVSEQLYIDKRNQVERENFNKERLKKLELDEMKEKELSKLNKQKLDKEIQLKQMHSKKREELNQKEIDTCLAQLNEINSKIVKCNQAFIEKKDERTAYLKTQSLMFELKKEQVKKVMIDEDDKKYEKLVLKMTKLEEKRQAQLKEMQRAHKQKVIHDKLKRDKAQQNAGEVMKQKQQFLKLVEQKSTGIKQLKRNQSMTEPRGFKNLLSPGGDSEQKKPSEEYLVKKEINILKDTNFQQNMEREKKKLEFKKIQILEKEQLYSQKIQQMRQEKAMVDRCKVESHMQALKNKETRTQALIMLKDFTLFDKKQKNKAKKLASQLVTDIDIEDVFKEEEKKKQIDGMQ